MASDVDTEKRPDLTCDRNALYSHGLLLPYCFAPPNPLFPSTLRFATYIQKTTFIYIHPSPDSPLRHQRITSAVSSPAFFILIREAHPAFNVQSRLEGDGTRKGKGIGVQGLRTRVRTLSQYQLPVSHSNLRLGFQLTIFLGTLSPSLGLCGKAVFPERLHPSIPSRSIFRQAGRQ
jgi:hypothetical protein